MHLQHLVTAASLNVVQSGAWWLGMPRAGQPPTAVFEITSRGTRLEDLGTKRAVYAMLGVQEYFLYDPWGEYQRIPPRAEGGLTSQALSLDLRLEGGRLRLINPVTGERLLTPAEAQAARRAAEAELERLRAELARLREEMP